MNLIYVGNYSIVKQSRNSLGDAVVEIPYALAPALVPEWQGQGYRYHPTVQQMEGWTPIPLETVNHWRVNNAL